MKYHDALSQLPWQDFEILVADYYRDQGFDVMHCGSGGIGVRGSGGVDLRLRKAGRLLLVQCRHETVQPVDAAAINRLLAVRDEDEAAEAIVISSSEFSSDARRAAEAGGITLVDGEQLRQLLGERLDKLPPPRLAPGIEPRQGGKARIVVKDLTPPSRGRRRWRWPRSRPRRGKRGVAWVKWLLALALVGLLVWQAPALKRLAGLQSSPPPAAAEQPPDGNQSVEVPLPSR
jgi:hypothetical protein